MSTEFSPLVVRLGKLGEPETPEAREVLEDIGEEMETGVRPEGADERHRAFIAATEGDEGKPDREIVYNVQLLQELSPGRRN